MENFDDENLDGLILPGVEISEFENSEQPKERKKKITNEVREKVLAEFAKGKSLKEVADVTNISKSSVNLIVNTEKRKVTQMPKELPEVKNPVNHLEMDDASFANMIKPAQAKMPEPPPPSSEEKANFLSKFMTKIDTDISPPTKAPKRATKHNVTSLLSDLNLDNRITMAPVEEDKTPYIVKIQMNVDNFADVLKDHIKPDREGFLNKVGHMGISDLKSTLKLLETVRSSNNMANQLKYLLFGATGLIEVGTQRFLGMKTQGYAQMVRQQEAEIQSCLREIAINNVEAYKKIERPEMRLATVLVTTLLATDSRNRMEAVRAEFQSKQVAPEVEKEYESL